MRTVLVPLDGTAAAAAALPVARTLARLLDAALHVVHVDQGAAPGAGPEALGLPAEALAGAIVDRASGPPAEAILRLAAERPEPVIVLCTHTREDKAYGALGSVAEEVLRGAEVPLVFVQPERGMREWELRCILLPHDGTPTTAAAIIPAANLACRAGARLIVLHAAAPGLRQPGEPGTLTAPRYVDQPQHEWPAWAMEFLERLDCLGPMPESVHLRLLLAHGEPGPEIVAAAREHRTDLIVLGWHGHIEHGRAATLLRVLHEAPCPVLLLRVGAPPLAEPCPTEPHQGAAT